MTRLFILHLSRLAIKYQHTHWYSVELNEQSKPSNLSIVSTNRLFYKIPNNVEFVLIKLTRWKKRSAADVIMALVRSEEPRREKRGMSRGNVWNRSAGNKSLGPLPLRFVFRGAVGRNNGVWGYVNRRWNRIKSRATDHRPYQRHKPTSVRK